MEVLAPPTPGQIVASLATYVLPTLLLLAVTRGVRPKRLWLRALLRLASAALVALLALIAFAFFYPHHHHDTNWISGRYDLNYPVDALIGCVLSAATVVAWWLPPTVARVAKGREAAG